MRHVRLHPAIMVFGIVLAGFSVGEKAQAAGWVSPTGHSDPENKWTSEANSYDGSTSSYASDTSNRIGYGAWINFTLATPILSDRVRVNADFGYGVVNKVDIDVKRDGQWVDVWEGAVTDAQYTEKTFTAGTVSEVRFRFNYVATGYYFWLYEIGLWEAPAVINPPTVSTEDPSSIEATTAVFHGKILDDGGSPCEVRFEYGPDTDFGTQTAWVGSHVSGDTFGKVITGLGSGTVFYRVQARNGEGTIVSGDDKSFATGTPQGGDWRSPTAYTDSSGTWESAENAFDDETGTCARAYHAIGAGQWSQYLYLTRDALPNARGVRFMAKKDSIIDQISIDVLRNGVWTYVYAGTFSDKVWTTKGFSAGSVTQARVRFKVNSTSSGLYWELYEFDFTENPDLVPQAQSGDRYWIASSAGNWSSTANWSTTSGGAGGASVPGSTHLVHFNGSGLGTCTIDTNANVMGIDITPTFTGTITQASTKTVTVGTLGYGQYGGTFAGGDAVFDCNGNFIVGGGTFTSTAGELRAAMNVTVSGTFGHNNGTVVLDGGSKTVSTGNAQFWNVVLNSPGGITVDGTMNIVNLTNTASNSQSTGVFAVSGNLVTTAQSLSSASATVLLNGSGNQTASANGGSGKICRIVVDKPSGVATFLDNLKVVNGFSQFSGTVDASQGTVTIADASAVIDTLDMTFGNLVFDTSGSVNISGTARAVNFSNLRSNSITGTLEVSGNVLTTSQSFSGAPGTLVLNGSGDQTISANGGSGKLPSIVIDKSTGGGSVNLQDTLKIVGGWDFQFADGVNAGTSIVEFCGGSASLYGPSMSFATLVLNTQGNLTLDSDLSTTNLQILGANALNGEAIRVSGDVLTTASTMSGASATVRLVGSGAQNVGAGGGAGRLPNFEVEKTGGAASLDDVLQVNGNWGHISGTVNPGTSTVSFVGISTRSISGAAVFNNLMLNRSFIGETVNVESDVSVLGALDVIKGALAIVEDNTLSVGGDFSIDSANGNLLANASTIAFNGAGAQAVDFGGRGVNNLTVSNAGGVVSFTSGVVAAEGSTATFLPGSSLKFANAQVFAFDLIDWKGAAGNPVTLRSDAPGMPWFLEAAGYPSATYVDVQDSDASGGETIIATNSNDNGGNSNWAFQGAGLLSITTAATSMTNPAWVEGTSGSDAVSLQITVDAGDPFDAVRLNPTKWFGDNASAGGASLGVTISATQATHIEVTATDALSNVNSVSQDITWAETDLTGKYFSTDTVKIRKGDSLLLTASGAGTTLEIDGDGNGTYESSGAPGDAFPTLYGTAGTFVARAKIDGAEVGSLTVVVIGVDLHGPVACELNWQRIQDTFVTPVSEVASVAFESANPFALTTSFNQNTATGVRLNLKPLKMGTPQFLARLGSGGPIFGTQEVKVFILKNLNTAIAGVAMDETGFGEGAFRFQVVPPTVIANDDPGTPETEGLFFDFLVTGGFLTVKENGQSSIRVPSTAQDENGLFEIEVLYDPSGTSVCSRIHAVQVNSPDVDAGPEHHANPCITKVCKVVWFQEEVNDETSAADKARQQGNINAHSKRFHAHPPFVPQLEDGQDHTVMWSQGRKFVFVGEPVGSDYFAALISPPKRVPVEYDVMARCEREHCPRVPPCPQMDDDGASSHRMVSLKSNPKDEVRAEIFYPFLVNEQMVGKATPGPTTFPHGTYDLSPPNWVGYNPGPEPHIDDPQICGPVPCPHPIDTCKKPIPCFGCNEYLVKYVNHWGTFDVHLGPNGACPKTDSPRIKDAITIIRLEAVGPKENEQQSGGFVSDPDGTVFPDLVGVVDQADIVRIDVSGGESAEIVQVTNPDDCGQSVVPANTRKGVIENNTNSFTFDTVLDPSFEIPEGATLTYTWDFGDGSTAEGQSAFHTYGTPGRYNVKLTLVVAVPEADPIVAVAELHSVNIIQEECDNERPHPGYLAEEERAGVPVRILARGPAGATVNVALHVRRRADIGQKGLGRVSLDGYPEDEYKNGFTPATSAATVEGLTQYYSMTIDGQAHFPPEDGSEGVETESLGDPEMVTWVVFLQGMGISDIADNVDLAVLGRENRASCDSAAATEPSCDCVYTPTDWEAFDIINSKLTWVDHTGKAVTSAFGKSAESEQPYLRQPEMPGGIDGFGGPPSSTGFEIFQDPYRIENLEFLGMGPSGLATITLDLISNVSNTATNAKTNTDTFVLTQLSSNSNAYAAENDVLGLMLLTEPTATSNGHDAFSAYIANPIFGSHRNMTFYESTPGSGQYNSRYFQLVATLSSPLSATSAQTIQAQLLSNFPGNTGQSSTGNVILTETNSDSNEFESEDGTFSLRIVRFTSKGPSQIDDFTCEVSSQLLSVNDITMDVIESGVDTMEFRTDLLHNQGLPIVELGHDQGVTVFLERTYLIRASQGRAGERGAVSINGAQNGNKMSDVFQVGTEANGMYFEASFLLSVPSTFEVTEANTAADESVIVLADLNRIVALPGSKVIASVASGAKAILNIVKVVIINTSRGGDLVVSAQDIPSGLFGGHKALEALVEPNTITANLRIKTKTGKLGTAVFDNETDILPSVQGQTPFELLGRDLSDSPRSITIEAEVDGATTTVFEFTVFKVELESKYLTTDAVGSMPAGVAGPLENILLQVSGTNALGKHGTQVHIGGNIMIKGKILPSGIDKDDFCRSGSPEGFDFKRTRTTRIFKGDCYVVGPSGEPAYNANDLLDDTNDVDEDLTADRDEASVDLFVYSIDSPGFSPAFVAQNGDHVYYRSNFTEWVQYSGTPTSAELKWKAAFSSKKENGLITPDNTYDTNGDNSIGPGTLPALAVNLLDNSPLPSLSAQEIGIDGDVSKKLVQLVPANATSITIKGTGFAGTNPSVELVGITANAKNAQVSNVTVVDDSTVTFNADFTAAGGFTANDPALYRVMVSVGGECELLLDGVRLSGAFAGWAFSGIEAVGGNKFKVSFSAVDSLGLETANGIPAVANVSITQTSGTSTHSPSGGESANGFLYSREFTFGGGGVAAFKIEGGGQNAVSPEINFGP